MHVRKLFPCVVVIPILLTACGDKPNALAEPPPRAAMTQPTGDASPTTRPRDPWVFRSVLDEQARMVTIALSDRLWIAYDAQTCSLHKGWDGGVKFTGGVYDARHGPQPQSQGAVYFATDGAAWMVETDGRLQPVTSRYRGYQLRDDGVVLRYTIDVAGAPGAVEVEERPEVDASGQALALRRTLRVTGLGDAQRLALVLPAGDARVAGTDANGPAAGDRVAGEPTLIEAPQGRAALLFSGNGSATVTMNLNPKDAAK
jgi:hypothetical protein